MPVVDEVLVGLVVPVDGDEFHRPGARVSDQRRNVLPSRSPHRCLPRLVPAEYKIGLDSEKTKQINVVLKKITS
jgi:hypothetical protein